MKENPALKPVVIDDCTTKNPLEMIGKFAGICYGSATDDPVKNKRRGINCLNSNHGRTLEFPDVYMVISKHSIKVMREFYTHIGGAPTRLQASTRYIDYSIKKNFKTVCPNTIARIPAAKKVYTRVMDEIFAGMNELKELGVPKEDYTNLMPLCSETQVVCKMNLRTLIDMSRVRMCSRAYLEFRVLFNEILGALCDYSDEWREIVKVLKVFKPKCEVLGYCNEDRGCGRMPAKEVKGNESI